MRLLVPSLFLAFVSTAALGEQLPEAPHITVIGHGSASGPADRAELTLGIYLRGEDLPEQKSAADEIARAFLNICMELGLSESQIEASSIYVGTRYSYDTGEFRGYELEQTFGITLENLDVIAPLLQRSVEIGINRVRDVTVYSSKAAELEDLARKRAIAHARNKAQAMASEAGLELGAPYLISEDPRAASEYVLTAKYREVPNFETGVFLPGPVEISVELYVVFLVEDDV